MTSLCIRTWWLMQNRASVMTFHISVEMNLFEFFLFFFAFGSPNTQDRSAVTGHTHTHRHTRSNTHVVSSQASFFVSGLWEGTRAPVEHPHTSTGRTFRLQNLCDMRWQSSYYENILWKAPNQLNLIRDWMDGWMDRWRDVWMGRWHFEQRKKSSKCRI